MKKIIASVGAVVIGLAGVQCAFAQELENEKALPWLSASLSVRGFYDDNIYANHDNKKDSYGFKVSPSVGLKYQDEQTLASVRYEYGYSYFGDRSSPKADQSHLVDAVFSHAFTDNVKLDVKDSFAVAQEPESISDVGGTVFVTRAQGNNMRNTAEVTLGVKYYENLGFELGYRNAFWDFDHEEYAFILNRMEHTPHIDLFYDLDEINRFFVGYQFNYADYNQDGTRPLFGKDGPLSLNPNSLSVAQYSSDIYNRQSHAGYVGYRLTLQQGIDWTTRVGVQYTDWQNVGDYDRDYYYLGGNTLTRLDLKKNDTTPFAESVLLWNYMENCAAQLGVRHEVGASQWGAMEAEVTTVYASVQHQFIPRLTGSLSAVYQHSGYGESPNTVSYGDTDDDYFQVSPVLSFRVSDADCPVNTYVELGYTYDNLHSTLDLRSYDRSRAFVGVKATY